MIGTLSTLRRLHQVNLRAPEATLLALVLISAFGVGSSGLSKREGADASILGVEQSLEAVPYRLGPWIGSDVPLVAGSTEILHTTAILSRRYSNVDGRGSVSLSVVFCSDVRDMIGHHPPACYPASGWNPAPGGHEVVDVRIGDGITANLFRFSRTTSGGEERRVSIVGFYVLPGVGATRDAEDLRTVSARRSISAQGVGQVQVLFDGWPDAGHLRDVSEEILSMIPKQTLWLSPVDPADRTEAGRPSHGSGDWNTERGGTS